MKQIFLIFFLSLLSIISFAQQEFHVFPIDHISHPGRPAGDGSLSSPWDLQTALSQSTDIVNSGDTIWLHEGIYNGRFVSHLKSTEPNKYITVSGFKNDKVVLNGNVTSDRDKILDIRGQQVIFKNFEVTFIGEFSRDQNDPKFQRCGGVHHLSGKNCKFYNLTIHDIPGLGFGSWKHAGGSIIENCMIFNNGYTDKGGKGRGEGIYVQNQSDQTRIIKNNIVFNNYYKGIEVWSAGKRLNKQFVQNITLEGNIVFNSCSPAGYLKDNVIIATNDRNGLNIARNIVLKDNILYHNSRRPDGRLYGDAASLTLGFIKRAPIEDVVVDSNIIIGGYNGLRILQAKSLEFTNNFVHTGIVQIAPSVRNYATDWKFNDNIYFSRLKTPFRVQRIQDHSLDSWRTDFDLDQDSELIHISEFSLENVLKMNRHSQNPNNFHLALFSANGEEVEIDFSKYGLSPGTTYKIYDVENHEVVVKSGSLNQSNIISFPMDLNDHRKPSFNSKALKTLSNFGVFKIEFENKENTLTAEESKSFFTRFLEWLGF